MRKINAQFMNNHFDGVYSFKDEFNTQRKLSDYFKENPFGNLEERLISLCANVLFLPEENENGTIVYHPRFNNFSTTSFHYLSNFEKTAIKDL